MNNIFYVNHNNNEFVVEDIIHFSIFGSKLYGTNTENSDTDIKGIYIPTIKEIILDKVEYKKYETGGKEKNTSKDLDINFVTLKKFLYSLLKSELFSIELLFTECDINSNEWSWIKENWENIHDNSFSPFFGAIQNKLIMSEKMTDKDLYHIVRLSYELEDLIKNKSIEFPLNNRDKLLDIKSGNISKIDREMIVNDIDKLLKYLKEITKNRKRNSYDTRRNIIDEFIIETYSNKVKEGE